MWAQLKAYALPGAVAGQRPARFCGQVSWDVGTRHY
jgi:hypothetical protein